MTDAEVPRRHAHLDPLPGQAAARPLLLRRHRLRALDGDHRVPERSKGSARHRQPGRLGFEVPATHRQGGRPGGEPPVHIRGRRGHDDRRRGVPRGATPLRRLSIILQHDAAGSNARQLQLRGGTSDTWRVSRSSLLREPPVRPVVDRRGRLGFLRCLDSLRCPSVLAANRLGRTRSLADRQTPCQNRASGDGPSTKQLQMTATID